LQQAKKVSLLQLKYHNPQKYFKKILMQPIALLVFIFTFVSNYDWRP